MNVKLLIVLLVCLIGICETHGRRGGYRFGPRRLSRLFGRYGYYGGYFPFHSRYFRDTKDAALNTTIDGLIEEKGKRTSNETNNRQKRFYGYGYGYGYGYPFWG